MVSSRKRQGACFTAVLVTYLLVSTPPSASAVFFSRNTGIVDILAAGLVTKMLMEGFGGGGGGGGGGGRGQGRASLFDHIVHDIGMAAARHHKRFAHPPRKGAESFLKYSYFPPSLLAGPSDYLPEEMRLHPQFLQAPRHGPLIFSETNALPIMSLPFEEMLSEQFASPHPLGFLGLPDHLQDSSSMETPIFADDAPFAGLRTTSQDVFEMRADQERPKYILPGIVRHFVQRFLRRGEQH